MSDQDTITTDHPLMRELRDALESLMLRRDLFIHCHDETVKDEHAARVDLAWRRYERAWNAVATALAGTEATGGDGMSEQKTHDYTVRRWGHDYAVMDSYEQGRTLSISGWGVGISAGDYLIFRMRSGNTARYQVEDILYVADPPDQWFATLIFAPRNPSP